MEAATRSKDRDPEATRETSQRNTCPRRQTFKSGRHAKYAGFAQPQASHTAPGVTRAQWLAKPKDALFDASTKKLLDGVILFAVAKHGSPGVSMSGHSEKELRRITTMVNTKCVGADLSMEDIRSRMSVKISRAKTYQKKFVACARMCCT